MDVRARFHFDEYKSKAMVKNYLLLGFLLAVYDTVLISFIIFQL